MEEKEEKEEKEEIEEHFFKLLDTVMFLGPILVHF